MRLKLYLLLGVIAALTGCYKDNGNYDYSDVNEITVEMPEDKYTCIVGSELVIEPILTFSMGKIDESDLEYDWSMEGETVSDERVLRYTSTKVATNVNCQLRVTVRSTGITYLGYTKVDFTEKYNSYGWLVLSKNEQATLLNFFTQKSMVQDVYEKHLDIYKEQNGASLPLNTLSMMEHFYSGNPYSSLWIVQPQAADCIDLEGGAFKQDITLKDAFLEPSFADNLGIKQIAELRFLSVAVAADGKAYTRKKLSEKSFHTGKFLSYPLTFGNEEVNVDRFVIMPEKSSKYMLFLEGKPKQHQRMLAVTDYDKNTSGKVVAFTTNDADYLSANISKEDPRMNDLKDAEVVYIGYFRTSTPSSGKNAVALVLKTADNRYLYQEYHIDPAQNANSVKATPHLSVDVTGWGDILENSVIYNAPYTNNPYLLIGKGTQLYYITRAGIAGENPVLLPLRNENGESISLDSPITALDAESSNSKRLGIGLANGKFLVVTLEASGTDVPFGTVVYQDQVEGSVKQIRYRYLKGNSWS